MGSKDRMPHNEYGERHGYWYITPKSFTYLSPSEGYFANFINDELVGYSEEFDVDYVVKSKEYYAK